MLLPETGKIIPAKSSAPEKCRGPGPAAIQLKVRGDSRQDEKDQTLAEAQRETARRRIPGGIVAGESGLDDVKAGAQEHQPGQPDYPGWGRIGAFPRDGKKAQHGQKRHRARRNKQKPHRDTALVGSGHAFVHARAGVGNESLPP